MERKRHYGYVISTGSDCIIIARDNPQHPGHALITYVNSLPDQFREYLIDATNSGPGQQALNLYEFLQCRSSPDMNMNLLQSLHARGYIQQEKTSNIMLVASRNDKIPLDELLAHERGQSLQKNGLTKTGVLENNLEAEANEERYKIAQNLLGQARELENEANKIKERAYDLYPKLRPQQTAVSFMEIPKEAEKIIVEEPSNVVEIDLPSSTEN